jgi:putative DNA primase/helicase
VLVKRHRLELAEWETSLEIAKPDRGWHRGDRLRCHEGATSSDHSSTYQRAVADSMTTLTAADLELHARLRTPLDLLDRQQVRRVDDREARDLLCVKHHGDLSGVLYPRVHPVSGYVVGYRVRRDHPEMEQGRPKNKYMSSSDRAHLYFIVGTEAFLIDVTVPAVFAEAERSNIAIAAIAERDGRRLLPVGTGGCWGWKGRIGKVADEHGARVDEHGPLPDLDLIAWPGRAAIIVFDGDAATNSSVGAARRAFAKELTARGAVVRCVDLPAGVNGPDDYIAQHDDAGFWALLDSSTAAATPTFKRTDAGNAELFASMHADDVRFDHAAQAFRVWTGHHFAADRDGAVHRLAKDAMRTRLQAAGAMIHDEDRKQEAKWAVRSESRSGLEALLAIARSERPIAVTGDDWDKHPMLLAVQNGVVDLTSGRLRDGCPDDGITRVAPVAYDIDARCPRWERFMREIFATHSEIADYLQRVMGYALTGLTTEQALWVLFGVGANGKSTLIETLMHCVFGADLAWTMPFPSASWSDSMGEYQKASLAGRRFVTSSEVARQGRLNEELVKSLTGSDTVNARHPYGRPFQFTPQAKFFLRVNDKPLIRDESHGMWRRIKLVLFLETFSIDTTLSETLASEAPGILSWAVRGCLEWQGEGLCEPQVVQAATAEYRNEQDQLSEFIDARCVVIDGVSAKAGVLFAAYKDWTIDNVRAEDRLSQAAFGRRLKTKFTCREGRHTTFFGISVDTPVDETEDRDAA